MNRSF